MNKFSLIQSPEHFDKMFYFAKGEKVIIKDKSSAAC